ncbi:RING finger domain-containing protein [Sansalvadorimonas verongulae]|uniref:RING finger domain-containing protein n=1 Tax=Sansalvadorimonas verongulae TaxID=2172824 RepID=UPI0012BCF1FB|nr:hypothetical protein [Sansalvadorimonas verongulae]
MSENHYLSLSHKKNPLTTCTICLEGFHWQENIHSTPCHHLFHSRCLLNALNKARHCPICRQPLPVYKPMRCSGRCSLLDFYLSKEEMEHEQARHTLCPKGVPFVCDQIGCNRTFTRSYELIRHRRTHHSPIGKHFICDEDGCQRFFLHLGALTAHRQIHLNSR